MLPGAAASRQKEWSGLGTEPRITTASNAPEPGEVQALCPHFTNQETEALARMGWGCALREARPGPPALTPGKCSHWGALGLAALPAV